MWEGLKGGKGREKWYNFKNKNLKHNQNFAEILIGIAQNLEFWERKINLFIFIFLSLYWSFLKLFFLIPGFNKFDYVLHG